MGFGGISVWQLLIVLLIVVMLFGTKRLKGVRETNIITYGIHDHAHCRAYFHDVFN